MLRMRPALAALMSLALALPAFGKTYKCKRAMEYGAICAGGADGGPVRGRSR